MIRLKFEYIIILTFIFTNITYADYVSNTGDKSEKMQKELNNRCELARENKLKPLRDNLITECLNGKRNSEDYCIRFYSTYGDAIFQNNGYVQPRMFNDLPECLKAFNYQNNNS